MKKLIAILLNLFFPLIALADGSVTTITKTVTVSAVPAIVAAAYGSGDLIGGKLSLSGTVVDGILSGIITSIHVDDKASQGADLDIVFFDADPSTTTFTDNAAFDPTDADLLKIICVVSITVDSAFADNGTSFVRNVNCPFKLTSNSAKTLYAAVVSRGTPTYASATDLLLRIGILQD
jgi:hypothetical protein